MDELCEVINAVLEQKHQIHYWEAKKSDSAEIVVRRNSMDSRAIEVKLENVDGWNINDNEALKLQYSSNEAPELKLDVHTTKACSTVSTTTSGEPDLDLVNNPLSQDAESSLPGKITSKFDKFAYPK